MATRFQQQVTQAQNTKRSAEGARAEAQQARAGIPTPTADRLIAQGDQQLTAGNDLLARGHPAEATGQYAAANASFNQATADAERERAKLAQQAAQAAAARQAAQAAAQQAAIARQREQAAAEQAAARTAAQQAAAAAAVRAALNAKAAAVAANTAALHTIAAQPPPPTPQPVPISKPKPEPTSSRPSVPSQQKPKPAKPPKANPTKPPPAPVAQATVFLPVYGEQLSPSKVAIVREIISIGKQLGASALVIKACLYAAAGESFYTPGDGGSNVFQTTCTGGAAYYGQNLALQAREWYLGGHCFARGGISYSRTYNTIWQIANATEENQVWSQSGGDSYTYPGRPSSNVTTSQLEAEVTALYDYYAGAVATQPAAPSHGHPPSHGQGSGPQAPSPSPAVHSGAWNGNPEGQQLQAAYQNYHDTLSKWNPGFRHQLQLLAHRPIGG